MTTYAPSRRWTCARPCAHARYGPSASATPGWLRLRCGQWLETFEPEGTLRRLTVNAFALAPRKNTSGVDLAKRTLADVRHDETNRFRADTRSVGVGDEAWSDQNRRDGDDRSRLLVRYRNLVVIADSAYGGIRRGRHPTGRALLRLQAKAVGDVLARTRAPAG